MQREHHAAITGNSNMAEQSAGFHASAASAPTGLGWGPGREARAAGQFSGRNWGPAGIDVAAYGWQARPAW